MSFPQSIASNVLGNLSSSFENFLVMESTNRLARMFSFPGAMDLDEQDAIFDQRNVLQNAPTTNISQ